jgi:hypothetical protein
LAKKAKNKVDYELIEQLDKELGTYYDANQPVDQVNYIKGNMISAESHPTADLKKDLFTSQNRDKYCKQIRSQTRKQMLDLEFREQAKLSLNRWD